MNEILISIADYILTLVVLYKYQALFVIAFGAAFALPLPSSSATITMAAYAVYGTTNIYLVFLVAFLGNYSADMLQFYLARRYGQKVFRSFGMSSIFSNKYYKELEDYIINFSAPLIFMTRFLSQIGPAVNIISGLTRVPAKKFAIYAALGELAYVTLYVCAGYFLGTDIDTSFWLWSQGFVISVSFLLMLTFRTYAKKMKSK